MTQVPGAKPELAFPAHLSSKADLVAVAGSAVFGLDVLAHLVDGIDAYLRVDEERWAAPFRSVGPAFIGSTLWFDDPQLADQLTRFAACCVLVTKQQRTKWDLTKFQRHRQLNQALHGLPINAFGRLTGRYPRNPDGSVPVVGPYTPQHEDSIDAIRSLGFRRTAGAPMVPLLHAKLAVIGHLWWHDEDPIGGVADIVGFTPRRVWIGSANFTASSRRNLESGLWAEEPSLLQSTTDYLVSLMGESEELEASADDFQPDLVEPDYDDEAFYAAIQAEQEEHAEDE